MKYTVRQVIESLKEKGYDADIVECSSCHEKFVVGHNAALMVNFADIPCPRVNKGCKGTLRIVEDENINDEVLNGGDIEESDIKKGSIKEARSTPSGLKVGMRVLISPRDNDKGDAIVEALIEEISPSKQYLKLLLNGESIVWVIDSDFVVLEHLDQ